MDHKHKIVIAEDHTILRAGLRALLGANTDMQIVGEAANGHDAIRCVERHKPHLVLMDLSMPRLSGMEAIRDIKKRAPEIKIIALTVHKTEEYILATLQAGADGYILKDDSQDELLTAIHSVLEGKSYLSPSVSSKVIKGYLQGVPQVKTISSWDSLSRREREVLKLIAEGEKNKDIAERLCISIKTVEKHRSNLMKKLDLHNIAELTSFAIEKGLLVR
jgi:DNA-binding NarL/FixJ family response regulator